ncbi:PH domain-containing protein [Roseibium denhamense]|uniref:PH domain-containing protein n=1 Tax=Roseibium denhamense TaxID=76305 RepID=A0ABY1PL35_9HYPH|nr:photosynthetic complex putative assembly protein PuhB [Roseibium denhamense]MTI07079.1 PH domain-containing protein [Roseibium denhamense]SMP36354.1 PH domain-containing protein [Roseibium denhamense]
MRQFVVREHEIEPVPGLPGRLPDDEKVLWQGSPSWKLIARHVLKTRWIAAYFAIIALWSILSGVSDGETVASMAVSVAIMTVLTLAVFALVSLYAWAVQKTTVYTITNKRVVIRFGVALSMALNLPFKQIETIAYGKLDGAAGNLAFGLKPEQRVSWLMQWPHVRGWRFARAEPSLIGLPDAQKVADLVVMAFSQYTAASSGHARITRRPEAQRGSGRQGQAAARTSRKPSPEARDTAAGPGQDIMSAGRA